MIKPRKDHIVVLREKSETTRKSGLIIPSKGARTIANRGEVIAVGGGMTNIKGDLIPVDIKVGDFVLFGKYSGTDVEIDGVTYTMIKEDNVFAVVDKNAKFEEVE